MRGAYYGLYPPSMSPLAGMESAKKLRDRVLYGGELQVPIIHRYSAVDILHWHLWSSQFTPASIQMHWLSAR